MKLTSERTRPPTTHIVNISGGKDSQVCALLAAERGSPFRLVMADTGNENQITIDHARYVADFVGAPLEMVKADFSERLAKKRDFIAREWSKSGVSDAHIERALEVLQPTGIPFLDLCLWKGRFPSRMAQFCTEFLKANAIEEAVIAPALQIAPVVQWLGVRRDESANRRNAPMFQRVRRPDPHGMMFYRPIIHWTAQNVFSFTESKGARHNPLYSHGMGRVGCFPCINAAKPELRQILARFPEAVERIMEWESLVARASRRGAATFFAPGTTPESTSMGSNIKRHAREWVKRNHPATPETIGGHENPKFTALAKARGREFSSNAPWPRANQVFEWSRTDRGGKQFNLLEHAFSADDALSCSSQYGLCE